MGEKSKMEITEHIYLFLEEAEDNTGPFESFLSAIDKSSARIKEAVLADEIIICKIPEGFNKRKYDLNGVKVYIAVVPCKNIKVIR